MPEMHSKQPGFTYSAYRLFTKKKKKESKSLKKTGDSRNIYQNELGKARCFQHDTAMKILKIYLEEQLLIKYCVIKYLILLKI